MSKKAVTRISQNDPIVEKIDFRFTIRNVRQLTTTTSSQVYVNGLPWQVKLKKKDENVTIELCCNYSDNTTDWSCPARAIFKLLSFATNSEMYEKHLDLVAVFSAQLPSITRNDELVKWRDLLDSKYQYISGNAVVVDVTIQAEKLRDASLSRLIKVETISGNATYQFKLLKVKGIIAMDSPEFLFRNIKCQLTISKRFPLTKAECIEDKHGYLGVWIVSSNVVDTSSYAVRVTFRLLSHRLDGKHYEKLADRVTHNRFNFSSRLIPLLELYESGNEYLHKDSITLEVDIQIEHIDNVARVRRDNRVKTISTIEMECILCYDNMIDQPISSTPCGHLFCRKCIHESLKRRPTCPICNEHVLMKDVHDIFLPRIQQQNE